jgi:hypothetical protein
MKDRQVSERAPEHNFASAIESDSGGKSHYWYQKVKPLSPRQLVAVEIDSEGRGIYVSHVNQQDRRNPGPIGRVSIESASSQANGYQEQRHDGAAQEYTQIDIPREKPGGTVFSFQF